MRRIKFSILTNPPPRTEAPTSGFFRKSSVGGAEPNSSGVRKKEQSNFIYPPPAMTRKPKPKKPFNIAGKEQMV
jgi:hypothetical protein